MPTGYTATLVEKGQDFRTFVLTCARAFGACVMQREDPMDEPPKRQEPSDYYAKALAEAKQKVEELKAMSPDQAAAHGTALRDQKIARATEYLAKNNAENERLDDMAAQVRAWAPPSDDHKEMKTFMLDQIRISRNDLSYSAKRLAEAKEKSSNAYFVEALSAAVSSVSYYERELAKEIERASSRNEWIDQLYNSLPSK